MSSTTEPQTPFDEFMAAFVMSELIRVYGFQRSREPRFTRVIARTCLVFRVHGVARKAIRVAIANLDEPTYNSIRGAETRADRQAMAKTVLMGAL